MAKYNNLANKGLYITTEEAQNSLEDNNHQVSFDYFVMNYSSVSDSMVKVTQKDLKKYYNEHTELYEQEKKP